MNAAPVSLAVSRSGTETSGPPLIIAHGLIGSGRNWGAAARLLGSKRPVVAVDMRNHGSSPWDPDHSYQALAEDLAAVIDAEGGQADVLGHSMGGKAAMVLALTHPDRLRKLVIVDIAPVAYGHSQADVVDALRATDLSGVARRAEADPRLAMHVSDPALRAFLLQSLAVEAGVARWKLNLEALANSMPGIMSFPDLDRTFNGPSLFVTGAASDYVGHEHHGRIKSLFPQAEFVEIADAGHWVHAEALNPFVSAVEAFLGS